MEKSVHLFFILSCHLKLSREQMLSGASEKEQCVCRCRCAWWRVVLLHGGVWCCTMQISKCEIAAPYAKSVKHVEKAPQSLSKALKANMFAEQLNTHTPRACYTLEQG